MIKAIIVFYTKILPEYLGKIFHHNQSTKIERLDNKLDDTEEKEQTNWIEDFDEREKNY
ncbi:MAG: hypothetical protein HC903_31790 [Methylacidiphilales bacterium]|nr:hypothetical protein [Candidatus Methylacidiphilales bacterium]NJR16672.1 hypothetical protein [Calothrix sp. CSU_2_0]